MPTYSIYFSLCARCARIDQSVIIMYYLRYSEHPFEAIVQITVLAQRNTQISSSMRTLHMDSNQPSIHRVLHRTSHGGWDALSYGKQNERCSFFFSLRFIRSTTSILPCAHSRAISLAELTHRHTRSEWRKKWEKRNWDRKRKHKPEKNNVERNSDLRKVNNNKIVIVDNTCSPQLGCFVYISRLFAFAWSLRFMRSFVLSGSVKCMRAADISRTGQFETLEPYFCLNFFSPAIVVAVSCGIRVTALMRVNAIRCMPRNAVKFDSSECWSCDFVGPLWAMAWRDRTDYIHTM